MKLDAKDVKILKTLLRDGRMSMREVAKATGLTTPTVSYRFSRMLKAGVITGFTPLLSPEVYGRGVDAFVVLRARAASVNEAVRHISALKEVTGVYVTTGEENILLRVHCEDPDRLEELITNRLTGVEGVEVASTQMIVKTVKDGAPSLLVSEGIPLKLKCDYCRGEITSDKPYTLKVGPSYHYFCCKTCRREFIGKYGARIEQLKDDPKMH